MFKILVTVAVICASLEAQVTDASTGASAEPFAIGLTRSVNSTSSGTEPF